MTMIATIITSTEPSRSAGFRKAPTIACCSRVIQVGDVLGMSCASPNRAFRKGTRRVKENTSSAAATTLHAIVPAIRQECGRR